MQKIMEITQEQLSKIENSINLTKTVNEILNISNNVKIDFGTTTIDVKNTKRLDIFKKSFNNRDIYYIVIEILDDECAFAYFIYPKG